MRVVLDGDKCVGHGRCYVLAPDVFGTDDFGHCEVLVLRVEGELVDVAHVGVDNCPEQAISLED